MAKKDFRFYDSRQKYLLFVTTTNEKNRIADAIYPHVKNLKPTQPALKIFDAGLGDGSLLMNIIRQSHKEFPEIPLLVSSKEISMEDVRLCLEKLPDRFAEHKRMVFVVTNMHYSEAATLTSNNDKKQKKINWDVVKLKGTSSYEFNTQLRNLDEKLAKNWRVESHPKSGNHTYKEPSVLIVYREDQEFILKNIIPTKDKPKNTFDLIIASQPYRSRIDVSKKVEYVIQPMINALNNNGKLLIIHASGKDPGSEIIKKIWPTEQPFPSLALDIKKYLLKKMDKDFIKNLEIGPISKIKYNLRALPNEIRDGISTSIVFSGWNAATYVNQMDDKKIAEVEKNNKYESPTKAIIKKHKGLWFNDELLVIKKNK
mgnify:CR=1 FL=1